MAPDPSEPECSSEEPLGVDVEAEVEAVEPPEAQPVSASPPARRAARAVVVRVFFCMFSRF
jgi:hypothetical protein